MKATEQMRQVRFSLYDRFVLTPIEFVIGGKYLLLTMALFFILSGLNSTGYSSNLAVHNGVRSAVNIFAAYFAGAVIGPILLPWLPGRSFSFKGFSAGVVIAAILSLLKLTGGRLETMAWIFLIAAVSSFVTMNFTGASTYTSLSGVRKEVRIAMPLQVIAATIGTGIWMVSRFV
jgi:acetyl-CoA decarbonylase/synthase complex subunit gamma